MKAAPFAYVRPTSVAEACALLAADEDARLIAGGQTLVPMMAMRLARPSLLVDVARIPELIGVTETSDAMFFGASTRQAAVERDPRVGRSAPLLARALPWVGHAPTRARGTIGGSVANADPAAEIPLALATLGGAILVRDGAGETEFGADEFFAGPMMTAVPHDGCVTRLVFPVWREARVGAAFAEISARRSDFAYVAAAAQVALDADGRCARIAVGVGAATPTPARLDAAMAQLRGSRLDDAEIRDALAPAVGALEIMVDGHASAAYRRRVALTLATRAVAGARDEARAREARP
jgi:CO/xanthine dehydrogenase FAD-binding subunit